MKIVIDISAEDFEKVKCGRGAVSMMRKAIINGTPLPEGAEILTKEAYSDLCRRVADVPDTNVGELISKDAVLDLVANYDLSMGEVVRGIHDLPSFTLRPEKRTETHACDCISRQEADVPNFESEEYIEQRLENYNKLLKSGMLDCVTREVTGKRG